MSSTLTYEIVDTGQTTFYGNGATVFNTAPAYGDDFYGQDAQFSGNQFDYTLSEDGSTVTDNVTGLVWTQSLDLDESGIIDVEDTLTYAELSNYVSTLNETNYGGRDDWRIPSIKELYSLMNFEGVTPSNNDGRDNVSAEAEFFIDANVFEVDWGDTANGDRIIDVQLWSSTFYTSNALFSEENFFGLNIADGRIKAYPTEHPATRDDNAYYALIVAGNDEYGINDLSDNNDETLTDSATGLMWTQKDSSNGMTWEEALQYVQDRNTENYLGYNDWRLPNAKELQSLVDYSSSPDITNSPAIDDLFDLTATEWTADDFTGVGGDHAYHWTSTTHVEMGGTEDLNSGKAVYISFYETLGYMDDAVLDAHGAGAQRSDPKSEDPSFSRGDFFGPQGDFISIENYVLLVRDTEIPLTSPSEGLVITEQHEIAGLYAAFFDRSPDAAGLEYWQDVFANDGAALKDIAASFVTHPVFTDTYGGMTNSEFVNAVYENMLGSVGDEQGISYWINELNQGVTQSDMVANFVYGSLHIDLVTMQADGLLTQEEYEAAVDRQDYITHKAMVAVEFANQLGEASNVISSGSDVVTDPAYLASIAIIENVDDSYESYYQALEIIDDAIEETAPVEYINNWFINADLVV